MIIIRLRSGLGNQMFQYAFFKQMQFWHGIESVKLDIDTYHWKAHNGLEINSVFNINLEKDKASRTDSLKMADIGYSFKDRVLRRIRGTNHKSYRFWKHVNYEEYPLLTGDIYIEGYWNEEKYFKDVSSEIKSIYKFNPDFNDAEKIEKIKDSNSVSLHIRRGDYIKYKKNFPMLQPGYYYNALEQIKGTTGEDIKLFVFSDDIEWCKKNLTKLNNVNFVQNKISYKDMMLMSYCKHNIIANSTFSWWAAWLNNNENKIVIYPQSCLLTYNSMPKNWIKL